MAHIICIFLLPFFVGAIIRKSLQNNQKKHLFTLFSCIMAVVFQTIAIFVPTHGSENYAVLSAIICCFAIGTLSVEIIIRVSK